MQEDNIVYQPVTKFSLHYRSSLFGLPSPRQKWTQAYLKLLGHTDTLKFFASQDHKLRPRSDNSRFDSLSELLLDPDSSQTTSETESESNTDYEDEEVQEFHPNDDHDEKDDFTKEKEKAKKEKEKEKEVN